MQIIVLLIKDDYFYKKKKTLEIQKTQQNHTFSQKFQIKLNKPKFLAPNRTNENYQPFIKIENIKKNYKSYLLDIEHNF